MIFVENTNVYDAVKSLIINFNLINPKLETSICEVINERKICQETEATIYLAEGYSFDNEAIINDKKEIFFQFNYDDFINNGNIQKNKEVIYYSEIILNNPRLEQLISLLKSKPTTRCGILNCWKTEHDSLFRSCPCLIYIHLKIINQKINMHVHMGSNDIYNVLLIDLHALMAIHRYISIQLNIDIGTFTYFIDSLHLYDQNRFHLTQLLKKIDILAKKEFKNV